MAESKGTMRSNLGRSATRTAGRRVSGPTVAKARKTVKGARSVSAAQKRLGKAGLTSGGVTGNRLKRTTAGKLGRRRLGQATQLRRAGVKRIASTKKARSKQIIRTARKQGAARG